MGLFSIFKKNKENEITKADGNTSVLENYFNSKFKINTDGVTFSSNDNARIEKNCAILEQMGLPGYKELKLVPVDSNVTIEDKQELVLHMIFRFFVGRKTVNRLNGRGDVDDADVMMLAVKYASEFDQLAGCLSAISKGEVGRDELNDFFFFGEQAAVLAWVLGFAEKPAEDKLTFGNDLVHIFETYNSIQEIIDNSNLRSKEEILEYADYISRLDFYFMELTISKKDTDNVKDLNFDCVREHKSIIDMVTSFSMDRYLSKK